MAQQITIDIVAETKKLTSGINEANDQLKGMGTQLKATAKVAAGLASAFVLKQGVTFLKQGIDEAQDAKIAMNNAESAFGKGSEALKKITEDADKFGKALGMDNDDIIKLATSLGSRLPKDAQSSAAELVNLAKDVEAFTGGALDAETVTSKLAKAFADGTISSKELVKIIPGLDKATYNMAEKLSKAGDNQGALNLLIEAGAKKYGDAAEKNVTSSQKFETALNNLKEEIGTKVLPIVEKLVGFLTDLLEAFDKQPDWLKNFELGLAGLVGVGGPLVMFVSNTKNALDNLGLLPGKLGAATTATEFFSGALKLIPILAVIALIVLLIQNWDDVSAAAKKTWEAVSKWFSAIYDDIKEFLGKAIDWVKQNWPLLLAVLTGPFGLFAAWIITHRDDVIAKFTEMWTKIKTTISGIIDATIKEIAGLWNTLRDYLGSLFSKGANTIFSLFEDGFNLVKDTVITVTKNLAAGLQIVWLEIVVAISEFLAKIIRGTIDGFTNMKDRAIEQFNKLKDAASTIWNNIKGFITDVATNIKDKMGEVFGYMVEVGKDIARGIWQGLSSMTGWFSMLLKGWVNANIPFAVRKILGIASPSKVMAEIGQYAVEGLYQGMGIKGPVGIQMPQINVGGAGVGAPINITINAGLGTDPYTLGREITTVLQKYGKISSRTI